MKDQIVLLIIVIVCCLVYFIPTIVACNRNHKDKGGITVLNLFLGWTAIGRIASLVWAFSGESRSITRTKTEYNDPLIHDKF